MKLSARVVNRRENNPSVEYSIDSLLRTRYTFNSTFEIRIYSPSCRSLIIITRIFLKLSFLFSLVLNGSLVSHFPPLIYIRAVVRVFEFQFELASYNT